MELVEERPNVELRRGPDGRSIVVLSFPYDPQIVASVRSIPQRRFDWDTREWWAPVDDWAGVHVAEVLDRFPELTTTDEVDRWLDGIERRWVGRVSTALREGAIEVDGRLLAPLTEAGAAALLEQDAARLDSGAQRCVSSLDRGEAPAPSRLAVSDTVDGVFLRLEVLWDRDAAAAFSALPGAGDNSQALPSDPWIVEPLDAFIALHQVSVDGHAARVLAGLRAQHDEAIEQIRASKADSAPPIT